MMVRLSFILEINIGTNDFIRGVDMNILVAGGAGFIGSHLVDMLVAEGHRVICVDNFFIGTKENIAHLHENDYFHFYEQDLYNLEELKNIFKSEQIEYVFHMAANSDIQASATNPIVEYSNTYTTTFNILECMRLYNVKNLFFCSTSAVYGDTKGRAVSEYQGVLAPISYYGGCKLGCEGLIHSYTYMNNLNSLIFRFPNVVGPRLTHGVIFDFMERLTKDSSHLRILGDGSQCKPYLHVDDLIDCIKFCKDSNSNGVSIYNVGSGSQTTVKTIADIVCQKMNLSHIPFEFTGGKGGWKGDVPVFAYDLSAIHALGWVAKMTSDEAVATTVEQELLCKQ